jgi:replication factor A1
MSSAEPRFILSLLCCDGTGSQWLTAFNEAACKLLDGKTAQELLEYKETNNEQAFNKVFDGNNFKTYIFKCRAKADNNMEEQRVRCHVLEAWPMDYKKESLSLIEMIEKYD